jgi:DNA-binding XRE family transcriptional regulator
MIVCNMGASLYAIINIELDKVTEPWRTATKLAGMYHPFGRIFFGMRLPLLLQRQKAEAAIRKIHSWQIATYFAQPWPMFRCRCRHSDP